MYFPLIRGRQYDLLALRELMSHGHLSNKIIPVVEPIKLTSTLLSTINTFEENERNIIIISNPKVGSLKGELSISSIYKQYKEIMLNEYVIIGHYFNTDSQIQLNNIKNEFKINFEDLVIIHSERTLLSKYNNIYRGTLPMLNIVPLDNLFRRKLIGQNLVGLEDKFNKLSRNADYLELENEFFSEEHLFFNDEGYIGFSDYSIVGEEYSESGFAPYAVAIHIVYPNSENALEIRHFVSDSNKDISDPAGKFSEALEKLIYWYDQFSDDERMNTIAMQSFIQHYREGTYPGLPTLKKLSIMHHLELVGKMLDLGD